MASLAVVAQECGYDENVLDAAFLSKLPPLSVEGVARIIIHVFLHVNNIWPEQRPGYTANYTYGKVFGLEATPSPSFLSLPNVSGNELEEARMGINHF